MEIKKIDIAEAQMRFKELLSLVGAGAEVILTEEDAPIVRMTAIASDAASRVPGLHPGAIEAEDDFDADLPAKFWTEGE